MNRSVAKILRLAAAACVSAYSLFAREANPPVVQPPISPVDIGFGGLQTSLTTGGYRFVIADAPPKTPANKAAAIVPDTFAACASLQNRSPFEIGFTFPTPAAADRKFTFRVFDSAGALVWQSDTEVVSPQIETDAALGKFQRWKRIISIPLKPGGKALASGIYTLEASIDADKQLGASSIFEVVAGTPADPTKTGITGLVLRADNALVDGQPAPSESAAAGALVVINEVVAANSPVARPVFIWSGKTDELGNFMTNAPAGRYRVTANYVAPVANNAGAQLVYPPKTVEIEVVDQKFTDVTIHLTPLTPPPPPPIQGIKGHVWVPNPLANAPNAPAEIPAVGARVQIDRITNAAGLTLFHWKGVTGPDGAFSTPTLPGTYKVTATVTALPPIAGAVGASLSVSVNVTVSVGEYAEAALHIGAPPVARQ